jgi:heme/copper-type cytochrome/quinol oxidase subunit 2
MSSWTIVWVMLLIVFVFGVVFVKLISEANKAQKKPNKRRWGLPKV